MRILFATSKSVLPQRAGGVEAAIDEYSRAFMSRGDVVAVLANIELTDALGIRNRMIRHTLRWNRYPSDVVLGYRVFRGSWPVHGIESVCRRFHPDIVSIQGGSPLPMVRRCFDLGIPVSVHLHDIAFHDLGGDPRAFESVKYFAVSRFVEARFRDAFGLHSEVVPNIVEPSRYETPGRGNRVVFINPVEEKGLEIALYVADALPDIPFLFVESWPLRGAMRRQLLARIRRLPNAEWRDWTRDMRTVYAHARLVIVPSQCEEAWGRIVSEAQVSGIPVVVSDRGGLREAAGPGGVVVPAGDHKAWTEAVRAVWSDLDAHARLSRHAFQWSRREEFAPRHVVDRYRRILARLAGVKV